MASTYSSLNVHIVFATKDRAPRIDPIWRDDLHAYIGGTIRRLGATAIAVGGVADHVHTLLGLRPVNAVADVVREVKKASSSWAGEKTREFSWQEGYAAFSVGHQDLSSVVKYIANQEQHHRKLSSAEEMRMLLAEFEIQYDTRYFE